MKPRNPFLAELPPATAAALLAKRAADVRMRKQAFGAAGDMLAYGGLGAGLGGLGGYAAGAFRRRKDQDAPSPWSTALTGALAGGTVGAGLAGASHALANIQAKTPLEGEAAKVKELEDQASPTTGQKIISRSGELIGKGLESPYTYTSLGGAGLATGQRALRESAAQRFGKMTHAPTFNAGLASLDPKSSLLPDSFVRRLQSMPPSELKQTLRDVRGGTPWSPVPPPLPVANPAGAASEYAYAPRLPNEPVLNNTRMQEVMRRGSEVLGKDKTPVTPMWDLKAMLGGEVGNVKYNKPLLNQKWRAGLGAAIPTLAALLANVGMGQTPEQAAARQGADALYANNPGLKKFVNGQ